MSVIAWDIETADADGLFTHGPGFLRLWGAEHNGGTVTGTDPSELIKILDEAEWVTGHNITGFDLLALAHYYGADWERLAAKAIDTLLLARLDHPPKARDTGGSDDRYSLGHVAERLGVEGKTGNLAELARKHGGYGQIPQDDPGYLDYLRGDVRASRAVFGALRGAWSPYARREHAVASVFGRMTLNGFAVNLGLLGERIAEGESRKREALEILRDDYDLPLGRWAWKGRGDKKEEFWEEFASPLSALDGREWLIDVYDAYGVNDPPVTDTGRLSTAAEALSGLADDDAAHPDLRRIVGLMATVTTTRTVYQTVADCLTAEGRVHPLIAMGQASGRSSVTNPGLTVFGKHGGRHHEREVFIPEPGHVLLSCDLSQLDMRAIAGLSQDHAYIEMLQPGKDLHRELAIQIFGSPDFRQIAKGIGHGKNYGLGKNKLISRGFDAEKVRTFYAEFARKFPRLCEWQNEVRAIGESGELLDNGFGRKMRCDPPRAYTQAPALMGQGAAADLMKEAMLRMPDEFRPYYRMFVHDELVFDVPADDAEEIGREIQRAMTFEWRGVPILCDLSEPGQNWGEISAK
jgi:DNA polymerase family A